MLTHQRWGIFKRKFVKYIIIIGVHSKITIHYTFVKCFQKLESIHNKCWLFFCGKLLLQLISNWQWFHKLDFVKIIGKKFFCSLFFKSNLIFIGHVRTFFFLVCWNQNYYLSQLHKVVFQIPLNFMCNVENYFWSVCHHWPWKLFFMVIQTIISNLMTKGRSSR